jgi:hypothetical protein
MALVAMDRAEQCASFDRFRNCGEMPFVALLELCRNACSRVIPDEFLDHRKLEDLADKSKDTAHRIDDAACLHPLHDIQDVGRAHAVDRYIADERKDISFEPADDARLRCRAACTCRGRQLFAGNHFEQCAGCPHGLLRRFRLFRAGLLARSQ